MRDIVARAVQRGELHEGVDAAELLETLVAPAYLRFSSPEMPLDQVLVDRSVRAALDVARRPSS